MLIIDGLKEDEVEALISALSTLHRFDYFGRQREYEVTKLTNQFGGTPDEAVLPLVRKHQGAVEILGRLKSDAADAHNTFMTQNGDEQDV